MPKTNYKKNGNGNGGVSELLKELWNAAVALRGNIEPADYKRGAAQRDNSYPDKNPDIVSGYRCPHLATRDHITRESQQFVRISLLQNTAQFRGKRRNRHQLPRPNGALLPYPDRNPDIVSGLQSEGVLPEPGHTSGTLYVRHARYRTVPWL